MSLEDELYGSPKRPKPMTYRPKPLEESEKRQKQEHEEMVSKIKNGSEEENLHTKHKNPSLAGTKLGLYFTRAGTIMTSIKSEEYNQGGLYFDGTPILLADTGSIGVDHIENGNDLLQNVAIFFESIPGRDNLTTATLVVPRGYLSENFKGLISTARKSFAFVVLEEEPTALAVGYRVVYRADFTNISEIKNIIFLTLNSLSLEVVLVRYMLHTVKILASCTDCGYCSDEDFRNIIDMVLARGQLLSKDINSACVHQFDADSENELDRLQALLDSHLSIVSTMYSSCVISSGAAILNCLRCAFTLPESQWVEKENMVEINKLAVQGGACYCMNCNDSESLSICRMCKGSIHQSCKNSEGCSCCLYLYHLHCKGLMHQVISYCRSGLYEDMKISYKRLLTYKNLPGTLEHWKERIKRVCFAVSIIAEHDFDLLEEVYETTLKVLRPKDKHIWYGTSFDLCKVWCHMAKYAQMSQIIADMHYYLEEGEGSWDQRRQIIQCDLVLFEIKVYTDIEDYGKVKKVYEKALSIRALTTDAILKANVYECGGKMHMANREWAKAAEDFSKACKYYSGKAKQRSKISLKYFVLALMLMRSELNPLEVEGAKQHENNPEVLEMIKLREAYQRNEFVEFERILETNKRQIMEDHFLRKYIDDIRPRTKLLELLKPYREIRISFISQELNIPEKYVENWLVSLMLDDHLHGHIDQINGILEIYPRSK